MSPLVADRAGQVRPRADTTAPGKRRAALRRMTVPLMVPRTAAPGVWRALGADAPGSALRRDRRQRDRRHADERHRTAWVRRSMAAASAEKLCPTAVPIDAHRRPLTSRTVKPRDAPDDSPRDLIGHLDGQPIVARFETGERNPLPCKNRVTGVRVELRPQHFRAEPLRNRMVEILFSIEQRRVRPGCRAVLFPPPACAAGRNGTPPGRRNASPV